VQTLAQLKTAYEAAFASFEAKLSAAFPGADEFHWHRAVAHMRGENVRRNDDTSRDAAMAANAEIEKAWEHYIEALHAFYALRDGPCGFLGSRVGG
jgi:hypothetical protein